MNDTCYEVKIISLSVNSNVESTDTPSSKIKDKQQYVVFVPSKFFHKISSNEKSAVYKCLLGCPSERTTTRLLYRD